MKVFTAISFLYMQKVKEVCTNIIISCASAPNVHLPLAIYHNELHLHCISPGESKVFGNPCQHHFSVENLGD